MSTTTAHLFTLKPASNRYLGNQDFGFMLLAAFVLHAMVISAVLFWPREEVLEIPVRTLNIKLGADVAQEPAAFEWMKDFAPLPEASEPAPEAVTDSNEVSFKAPAVPKAKPAPKPKPVKKVKTTKPRVKQEVRRAPSAQATKRVRFSDRLPTDQPEIPANIPTDIELPAVFPPVERMEGVAQAAGLPDLVSNPHQYVRRAETPTDMNRGVTVGQASGVNDAEAIRARYEQKISAWLQRHRVYPEEAKELGQEGKPVLRVRMDRGGKVKYFAVEQSTGFQILDRAAMDMVNRANPFPAPPPDYPAGELLEFLIPVTFNLN